MIKLRKKQLSKSKQSLYLDIYVDGRRRYEFLKLYLTSDKTQNKDVMLLAENIRAKRQIEIQNLKFGFIPEFKKKTNFVEYLKALAQSKNLSSKLLFGNCINYVTIFSGKNIIMSSIDENWLKDFENLLKRNISINSAICYMRVLHIALNNAVREKMVLVNPFQYFKTTLKKQETKKEFLSFEELQEMAVTNCENEDVKRSFLFACYTGLRVSDIRNLRWNDIKENNIDFRQKKTKGLQYLPLAETAKQILNMTTNNIINLPESTIFNLPPMLKHLEILNTWVKAAGIPKHITTHSARHTFATLSLTQGVDLYTVSKLLGHSSVQSTQIYGKIIDLTKKEAINKLPFLNFN